MVAYKAAADIASKAVTLVVTVAAARALPPSDFGVMALAMTTGWLLGVASDAGLPMFAATRVAQAHATDGGTRPIADAVIRWRSGLVVTAFLCAMLAGLALVPSAAFLPFLLIALHQLLGAMLDTVAHVYRGLGRTDIESTISIAHRGAIAIGALAVLALQPTLLALSLALAGPPLVACLISLIVVRRVTADGPRFSLDPREFVRRVAPLGAGVLLSALYFRIDVYFLERLHGVEVVGVYNAAFRLVDAVRLFPAALLAVAYPLLCAANDLTALKKITLLLAAISTAIAIVLYVSATPLLTLVYGEPFAHGGSALRALAFSVPFFFVNYALTHQLIAWDRSHAYVGIAAAALATNLVFNSLLIPQGAMTGAAYSTLITEIVVCGGCLLALRRQ